MSGKIDLWARKHRHKCAGDGCNEMIPSGRKYCYECADSRYDNRTNRRRHNRYHRADNATRPDPAS